MEKERELEKDTDLYLCESVEISGKHLYMYFHVYRIKDMDRLAEFERITDETVSGTVPSLVARLKAGDKLLEYYEVDICDVYGGELYIKRITEDRPCRKHGLVFITYHEDAECNYVLFCKEKDEFGEADQFDYLVYEEMMKEMVRYVEQGAEVLFLSARKCDPVEYAALVEDKEWAKKLRQKRTKPSTA